MREIQKPVKKPYKMLEKTEFKESIILEQTKSIIYKWINLSNFVRN